MKHLFVSALLLLASQAVNAGTFFISHDRGGTQVNFEGPIVAGDTNRLLAFVRANPGDVMKAAAIRLNSPGGSVAEAVKLGGQLERSGFMVTVESGQQCASACFLLFVSGQFRSMHSGAQVLLHRPYVASPKKDMQGYEEDRKSQQASIKALRDFLEERAVSSRLVDKMMNYPSATAYRLQMEDLDADVRHLSPTLEELTLGRCGLSNQNIFSSERDFSGDPDNDDLSCIRRFTMRLKFDYVESIIGPKRFQAEFEKL